MIVGVRGGRMRIGIVGLSGIIGLSGACFVAPNPEFLGDAGETLGTDGLAGDGETGGGPQGCPAGTADCDDAPGCEADLDDPLTCGSCDKHCELGGQTLTCAAGECQAVALALPVVSDAYVDAALPEQNFGADAWLRIDDSRTAYLELDGLLAALPVGATVESASLRLTCTEPGDAIELIRVEAPWTEDTLTHANAPALTGTVLTTWTPVPGTADLALDALEGPWSADKHSLGLRAAAGPGAATTELVSSEGGDPPALIVTLSW